jgi:phosphate starvation-inducible protein PhoH
LNSQKKLINSIKDNEITICAGRAGTGKTFAAECLASSLGLNVIRVSLS